MAETNKSGNFIHFCPPVQSIAPEVPIIVHVFSNGGCSCVSGLLAKAAREGQESSAAAALRRVAAWVFDSCPAYLHTSTGAGAVAEGFGNSVAKSLAYGAMYAVLWSATLFAPTVAEDFWRPLTDNPLEAPQLYLYSQTDHLTLTSDLEPLIAARRERGHTVHALCFQDSPHVSHLRSYPGIYTAAVRAVVNQASNSASSTPETFAASLAELSGLPGVAPLHLEGAEGAAAAAANTGLWSTNSKGTQQLSARVLETVQDLPVAFSGRVCQSPPADAADAKM